MEKETPTNVEAWLRIKHKKWNKGHKANICICGFFDNGVDYIEKVKCEECGKDCFCSMSSNSDLLTKKFKKICVECALFNPKWSKKLNKEQKKILEKAVEYGKRRNFE